MSFRFDNLEGLGNEIPVSIPTDDEGYLGRECPHESCLGYFKVKPGTGLSGEDLDCHCPYCGHTGPYQTFSTQDQIEYAKSVALRQVSGAITKDLKSLEFEHKPRGSFGIGISMKVEPGAPIPLHQYAEKELETYVTCESCTLDYAVYGLFGFCPDCGEHNSLQILQNNLTLISRQVDLALSVDDDDLQRHLLEDALENCVSAFDGFGRETFEAYVNEGGGPSVSSPSFQNLNGAADRLEDLLGLKLKSTVDTDTWEAAQMGFLKRHVLSHRAGVVDQAYLDQSGDTSAVVGRRLSISATEVKKVADSVSALGHALVALLKDRDE